MKKLSLKLMGITLITLSMLSCSNDDNDNLGYDPIIPNMFIINAKGAETGEMVTDYELPGIDLTVSGNAFSMPMYDPVTSQVLGTAIDISVAAETFEDGSMFSENYTIFMFNDEYGSTLVLHNFIDMVPESQTHMNAFIKKENTTKNVISGTGLYAGFSGGSTLIATLDMTNFSENIVGFDCIYGLSQGNQ